MYINNQSPYYLCGHVIFYKINCYNKSINRTEHTFSTSHQLKNYLGLLRSTMTQEQLNHVILLYAHKDCTDNINLLEIAKEFVSFKDRLINFLVIVMFNNITPT